MSNVVFRWMISSLTVCFFVVPTCTVRAQSVLAPARQSAATKRQQQWLAATPYERQRLAEKIGEDGARTFAKQKGWDIISDGLEKVVPQGPDQVCRGADGTVHVIEAKGGSSRLGWAYGHPQGSADWAVESAKRVLRSPSAGPVEKRAAQAVLESAAQSKLQVHVVRTKHCLGEPMVAVLEQTTRTSPGARRAAADAIKDLARAAQHSAGSMSHDAGRAARIAAETTDDVARSSARAGNTVLQRAAKGAVVVGAAVDVGLRVKDGVGIEQQYRAGEISQQQREVLHARNAAGMAGGWGGAAAGAWIAAQAAAPIAAATGPAAPYVEGGAAFAGSVAGYIGGEKAAAAAVEFGVRKVHAAGTTIADAAASGARTVRDAAGSVRDSVRSAWNWAWGQ